MDCNILDNKTSQEFNHVIEEDWHTSYQLVPPDIHCQNATKRIIHTFKAHFLAILVGVDPGFLVFLWDKLLAQAKLMVNLLCQASAAPHISTWEFFNVPFNYNAMPGGPADCKIFIHNKPSTGHS